MNPRSSAVSGSGEIGFEVGPFGIGEIGPSSAFPCVLEYRINTARRFFRRSLSDIHNPA